ncbi:MAG: DMT family transporter [Proteobacteria bacterium]|nr:MAG: DMT family transporter [Pseudomonadota bacterium]
MSWPVLLGLVICNAIWATNPIMGKILLQHFPPLQVSCLRYGSALLMALACSGFFGYRRSPLVGPVRLAFNTAALPWVAAMGFITFFGSAVLQFRGLAHSTSTANAILVALEPLFAVFLAWAFLGEEVRKRQGFAFLLAVAGFLFLSNLKPHDFMATIGLFSFGNFMLLLTMPMEAMYSIISRRLGGRVPAITLFTSALLIGFAALIAYLLASGLGFPDLRTLDALGWFALLWVGPLGTAITYTYWTVALEKAPVAAVSLTLFVQPILGAGFASFFLGERLDLWQAIGGALIVGALALQTTVALKPAKMKDPL